MNRETWLLSATDLLKPLFKQHGYDIPKVKVSTGLPFQRSGSKNALKVIGQYWNPKASDDQIGTIFISPTIDDSREVLATLVHELAHAVVGTEHGHDKVFRKCAIAVGLTGKMKSTTAGIDLIVKLDAIILSLSPYPHSKLNPSFRPTKKQSTRLIKQECSECEYIVRSSQKCIDAHGPVICPSCQNYMSIQTKEN
jgi:hypothetical protein